MTSASLERTAEAPVAAYSAPRPEIYTPASLPDRLSLLKLMGGVLLLTLLGFALLSVL